MNVVGKGYYPGSRSEQNSFYFQFAADKVMGSVLQSPEELVLPLDLRTTDDR